MNFPADTLIALAFLAPVAAFALAGLFATGVRPLESASRMVVTADSGPMIAVDVRARAANDDQMREAA